MFGGERGDVGGGVLVAADVAGNYRDKLDYPILFEDQAEGERTLRKLAAISSCRS